MQPDRIPAPAPHELEVVVTRFREAGEVAAHVTFRGLVGAWANVVEKREQGYGMSIYELANDVDSRVILDRVLARSTSEARRLLIDELRPLDARFEQATVQRRSPTTVRRPLAGPVRIPVASAYPEGAHRRTQRGSRCARS